MNEFLNDMLVKNGYDALSVGDKNVIIMNISNNLGVEFNKVTEQNILDYHKDVKKSYFSTLCEQTVEKGFTATNGNTYRTNRDDQIRMMAQKLDLNEDQTITEVPWKTENEDYITHTREEWLQVYKEAFVFVRTQLFKYAQLKKDVQNAQSHPEIVAIVW